MRTREDWSARKSPGTKTVESGDATPFCMFDFGSRMILVLFYSGYSLRQQSASDVLFSARAIAALEPQRIKQKV